MGELDADDGEVEWGYETHPAYFAQDHRDQFDPPHNTAEGWVWDSCPERDIGYVRARMALMLFSGDDSKKRLSALSGGEAARLVFTRLSIARPNVLVLDEPTNHLDLESIEALVDGLKEFPGTLILVSHDRWFVSRLATRIVEIKPEEIRDYHGTYEEYVHFCGDDHLDADRVILKAKTEKRKKKGTGNDKGAGNEKRTEAGNTKGNGRRAPDSGRLSKARKAQLLKRQEELTASIDKAEARVSEIDEIFCEPNYYERTAPGEVKALETERTSLQTEVGDLMSEWEKAEEEVG
jgi:ABC-type multidrug transport system ATPase subunit